MMLKTEAPMLSYPEDPNDLDMFISQPFENYEAT